MQIFMTFAANYFAALVTFVAVFAVFAVFVFIFICFLQLDSACGGKRCERRRGSGDCALKQELHCCCRPVLVAPHPRGPEWCRRVPLEL